MKYLPLAILFLIGALTLSGCAKPMDMATAVVEVYWSPSGQSLGVPPSLGMKMTLTDKNEVDKLASFFPHVGQGRKSSIAAAWLASVSIQFTSSDGKTAHVNSNYEFWSEGDGDWPADPEFAKYMETLLEKTKAEP